MKKTNLFLMLSMLFAALILTSCSRKVPDYAKLIPADADVVVRVDVRQLAAKCGFGKDDKMSGKLEKTLTQGLSEKAQKKVAAVMKSPAQLGLDLRDPVLLYFCRERGEFGMAGTVYKADRFADFLNVMGEETGSGKVSKTDDLNYITLSDVLFVFNDDWFFVTNQSEDQTPQAQAKAIAKRYASEKNPWAENEAFRRVCKKGGVMQAYVNGNKLYQTFVELFGEYTCYYVDESGEAPADEVTTVFDKLNDSQGIDVRNMDGVLDISMERAELKLSLEAVPCNDQGRCQVAKIDHLLGGKKHGLYMRMGIDLLAASLVDDPDDYVLGFLRQWIHYVELKYEGDARMTYRLVTRDITKTPMESLISLCKKELGL